MSVLDIHSVEGFTPESLPSAIDYAAETGLTAVVLSGMASNAHNRLVKLHKEGGDLHNRYEFGGEFTERLEAIGFDLGYLARQNSDISNLPFVSETQLTVDVVAVTTGIDWHTDIVPVGTYVEALPEGRFSACIPFGYGISINLSQNANFRVATECPKIKIDRDANKLKSDELNKLLQLSSIEKPESYYQATLRPGDVIVWKQPAAHYIETFSLSKTAHKRRKYRRAFAIVNQDIVTTNK